MRPAGIAGAVLLTVLILTSQSPALASDDEDRYGSDRRPTATTSITAADNTLTVDIGATRVADTIAGLGVAEWVLDCVGFRLPAAELPAFLIDTGGAADLPTNSPDDIDDPDQEWAIVQCAGIGTLNYWPAGDPPPPNIQDWLAARARATVAFPIQVGQAAPFGDHDAPLITQLPTWLWVDEATWAPISATPSPVLGYTATATATPVNVTFASNTGDIVDCGANIGPAYDSSLPDDAQTSPCTITYHHSSAVGDWNLTTTITWAITWTCTPTCGSGTLPDQVITTTRPVRVAELQALNIPFNN